MNKYFLLLFLIPIILFSCKKSSVVSAEDQAKIDKAIILKYIADNSLVADSTNSGLYYVISNPGIPPYPDSLSRVNVYYKGYLINGVSFDQNTPGLPELFFLNQVIKGWNEGVRLIGKGGKIKLLIPSALGYGTAESASIPANSVLIFDIELDSFQ